MASKKKESEGIALLSMYNDEDEDVEDLEEDEADDGEDLGKSERGNSDFAEEAGLPPLQSQASLLAEDSTSVGDRVTPPVPQHRLHFSSPGLQSGHLSAPPVSYARNSRKRALAIVDYGHDETAMSPEAEEGEIMNAGHIISRTDLQTVERNLYERTSPGTVQILTPNNHATPQASEQQEPSQSDNNAAMDYAEMETEAIVAKEDVMDSVGEQKEVDPLETFLPSPPKAKCSEELQEKINKFLAFQRAGKSFNAEVRNRKDYRNPDFLQHAVTYQGIDEIGSCFSKDVFDPHGYDKTDFYYEIEADMKREMERKEQERKKSGKVDYVAGGTQPGTVAVASKIGLPIPTGQTVAASGFHSGPSAVDAVARDSRQGKKSKWDKVDGERKNPLHPGGQDALSTAASHAALLSAANVGAGYTAFAQQKRREAEERRSIERKRS